MEVRDLMHRPAVTCEPAAPLSEVAHRMGAEAIGSLLVVDHHGVLAGIVTDRDLALKGVGAGLTPDEPVESVMSRHPATVHGYEDAFTATAILARTGCRRLPVVDRDGHLEGVIALDDLVIAFTEQLEKLAHILAHEQATAPAPTAASSR